MINIHAKVLKTGNHICRADVCYKGRIGKLGFCRMLFWHWVQYTTKKGERGARRQHGMPLLPRWNGTRDPPVHAAPPQYGLPAFEVNHPFYIKMCPAIYLGPGCNHDLGVLLRLPPSLLVSGQPRHDTKVSPVLLEPGSLSSSSFGDISVHSSTSNRALNGTMLSPPFSQPGNSNNSLLGGTSAQCSTSPLANASQASPSKVFGVAESDVEREKLIESMIETMVAHEYYCAAYASKDQPHTESLLLVT